MPIHLFCEGSFTLEVINAFGVKVYETKVSDTMTLSLAGLSHGVYYVRLTTSAGQTLVRPAAL